MTATQQTECLLYNECVSSVQCIQQRQFVVLQGLQGPWHLQSIEILEKPSGKLFYFPCPQWLDTAGKPRVKLNLGQKPAKTLPVAAAAHSAEAEDWRALVTTPDQATQEEDLAMTGITGKYTVCTPLVF